MFIQKSYLLQIDLHLLNQHHLLRLHTNFIVSIFLGFHTILLRICIFFSSKTSCCFRSCDCGNFTVDSVSLIGSFFSIQQSTIVVLSKSSIASIPFGTWTWKVDFQFLKTIIHPIIQISSKLLNQTCTKEWSWVM